MTPLTITAQSMADLLAKVYAREGWIRAAGESRTARVKAKYKLSIDYKLNKFIATEKEQEN